VVGTLLLLVLAVVALGAVAYATTTVPGPNKAALAATTTVYYADGRTVLGQFAGQTHRQPLTSEQMPDVMKQAAVASEDRTFYTNKGVSVSGLGRAVVGVLTGSDRGGGSTITQQYVKNITGNDEHTYTRKAREALIALKMDRQTSKDEILTNYLNTIYFGRGSNGVATAAQAYFGLDDPSKLTVQQAALLVGIIPSPSAWDPRKDPQDAQKRYTYVLQSMAAMGYVTQAEADAQPTMPPTVEQATPHWYDGPNGYILQAVKSETVKLHLRVPGPNGRTQVLDTADEIDQAGLKITTTIDPRLQQAAEDTMADPKAYPTRGRTATVQAGLISVDPGTGGIVAMYGGADYRQRQLNAVTQDSAQAGSTFKPFTLVAALEDGTSLYDTFDGHSPQTIKGYTVPNFGPGRGEQFGRINLLTATEESVNTVFVRLNQQVGPEKTVEVAQRLGVRSPVPNVLSNVLGTATVHAQEMAGAYSTLAAGGVYRAPHLVTAVSQGADRRYQADTTGRQVIDPAVNANAVYAMQQVVRSGTAASAGKALGKRPAAGKTGTVNDNLAAWFNGFTPQLETAVVLYNPDPAKPGQLPLPKINGKEVTGGTVPTTIWTSYMAKALKGSPVVQFPKPSRSADAATATATATSTPTATATATATDSPTDEPTATSTDGATDEPTATSTDGATSSPTRTSGSGSGDGSGNGSSDGPTGFGPGIGVGAGADG
jgi:membrane peptidoglycan carboxypeptidase